MADGVFKFLLNYIDHGIKKLNSIPLVAKHASCVAVALFTIFTEQGPPTILQTDNAGEFSQSTKNHTRRLMKLDNAFVDLVIKELKHLWPECHLVRGSPRHSESNGGVEHVNQTVQKKLGAWMKENKTKHWAIGCRMVQWRYNTQVHQTLKDTPYHLTYGQHACVGISNLPVEPSVLANLTTEAGLQDVYSQMRAGMIHDENQALSLQALVTTPYSNTLAAVAASVGNLHQVAESVTTVNKAVAGSSILSQKKRSGKSMHSTDKLQHQTK